MMERWNKTMENINDYSKKQADMVVPTPYLALPSK